jgi:hypothetical protein
MYRESPAFLLLTNIRTRCHVAATWQPNEERRLDVVVPRCLSFTTDNDGEGVRRRRGTTKTARNDDTAHRRHHTMTTWRKDDTAKRIENGEGQRSENSKGQRRRCGPTTTGSYHLHHVAPTVAVEHLDQLPEMK